MYGVFINVLYVKLYYLILDSVQLISYFCNKYVCVRNIFLLILYFRTLHLLNMEPEALVTI